MSAIRPHVYASTSSTAADMGEEGQGSSNIGIMAFQIPSRIFIEDRNKFSLSPVAVSLRIFVLTHLGEHFDYISEVSQYLDSDYLCVHLHDRAAVLSKK